MQKAMAWFAVVCTIAGSWAVCRAGTEQLTVSIQPEYTTIIQGYKDSTPITIKNVAPSGSDTGFFSLVYTYGGLPYSPVTDSVSPGNSVMYGFSFDSSTVSPGPNQVTAQLTDTATGVVTTSSSTVTVLRRSQPAFYVNGAVVPLSSQPISKATSLAESVAGAGADSGSSAGGSLAPNMIGDPPPSVPTDELDLDSVTAIGDPEITSVLQPFTDLPPDDYADAVSDPISIDTSVPGTFYTEFELNYSDEQDLPGADSPGSEQAYYGVVATVADDGSYTYTLVVPEPATGVIPIMLATWALIRRTRTS
jgi:hypothetical protein